MGGVARVAIAGCALSRWPCAAETLGRRLSRPHRRRPLRRVHHGRDEHDRRADHHAQSRATRRRRHPRPPRPLLPDDRADGEPTRPRPPRDRSDHNRHPTPTLHGVRSADEGLRRALGGRDPGTDHRDPVHRRRPRFDPGLQLREDRATGRRRLGRRHRRRLVHGHRAPCRARRRTAGASRTGSPEAQNSASPDRRRDRDRRRRARVPARASAGQDCTLGLPHGDASSGPGGCRWTRGRMRGRVEGGRVRRSSEGRTTTRARTARCRPTTCWPGTSRTRTRATTTRPCHHPTPTTAAIRPSAGRSPTARPTSAVTCSSGGRWAGGRRRR